MKQATAVNNEPGRFRQAMAWLHTWGGLVASWALFAIFLTGTIGVFDDDITHWMNPERAMVGEFDPQTNTQQQRLDAVTKGEAYLRDIAPQSHLWRIRLPSEVDPAIGLTWENENEQFQQARLHPVSGELLTQKQERETQGGHHFVHMHFEFHAGTAGIWLVGFFTMIMLVALVSGIIIHKRIFKDFFTFRPGKGQRSWLDAHNASSVLSLPFQLMIAYTGLIVFVTVYMPVGVIANYDHPRTFFAEVFNQPEHRPETGIQAEVYPVTELFEKAEALMEKPASFISVEHPGDSSAVAKVFGLFEKEKNTGRLLFLSSGQVILDAVTGELLHIEAPDLFDKSNAFAAQRIMRTLHFANFGGYTVRWIYFILGMAGTIMMATGAILFMVKRRQRSLNEFGAQTPKVYRAIEVLNISAISGLMVACIAFFWVNRLLPLEVADRAGWEIKLFFFIWLGSLLHAALRPASRAWIEQLIGFAVLSLLLPIVNWLTTGQHLFHYFARGDWSNVGFELTILLFGVLGVFTVKILKRKQQKTITEANRVYKPESESA
ncbi:MULTISPECIES: PepSY-associated TM helix domain-containing protein [unclassified Methylophaga]|uniref:PepSY-associated TM helix domain-containing protein n=1 Tax=unclassified Methylophaga TaxID=2629249 RepID=UPI000C976AC7|nr:MULTISPECIES: PepSY-associated TM helix domain-containing protein [unclassified Methylophaga]MBN46973.1 iron-regulated protein [Methylophaga sp.]|tara:strand:+ start:7060 stop:8703 length:1644 start_codon:yes stop_codon:yes gene_type:complete